MLSTKYFAAYLMEWSLSIDNIFVIAMIFSFFKIPLKNQHKLLFWGVFGAIFFRAIMIFAGIALIQKFSYRTIVRKNDLSQLLIHQLLVTLKRQTLGRQHGARVYFGWSRMHSNLEWPR